VIRRDIVMELDLAAAPELVWQALSDHRAYAEWAKVALYDALRVGEVTRGQMLLAGYQYLRWDLYVEVLDPVRRRLEFSWHPYACDPNASYDNEPRTRVELWLNPLPGGGTRLNFRESGFDRLPSHRCAIAHQMNTDGWHVALNNLRRQLDGLSKPANDDALLGEELA